MLIAYFYYQAHQVVEPNDGCYLPATMAPFPVAKRDCNAGRLPAKAGNGKKILRPMAR